MKHSTVVALAVVAVIAIIVFARDFYRKNLCEEQYGSKTCVLYDHDLEKIQILREMWQR
ncbi:hypothetical protein EV675_2594 [Pigmentiphaga kullae]|uniref:Uncharacterized protein n=1 Tax=Pigmentiphaga kullae TaxID=151784 RepID=A0A4Q7NPQ2_9BURK|nr:hypothetical protein EV675_2594 [Pigmentiphaga kullae]